jgi:ubiquinone/menaquinone biosynthesis C-methylase UbiE
MKAEQKIYLPGGVSQFEHLLKHVSADRKDVLIIGSNAERIAQKFLEVNAGSVSIIIDEYDSLLKSRFILKDNEQITIRLMDFTSTDFKDNKFDIIYAQGSASTPARTKIIKEIKRIVKNDGIISIGELTSLKETAPRFVYDIWESGNILPIFVEKLISYYSAGDFEIISLLDLSKRLEEFYKESKKLLEENINSLSDNEKSYYKKILKRMSHESNAYLKLGASNYMGFTSIILKKLR